MAILMNNYCGFNSPSSNIPVLCCCEQIVFVGMAVGCSLWGWLSDNFGRKSVSYLNTF